MSVVAFMAKTPLEDLTERAAQRVCDVARDFEIELAATKSVDRSIQLRERLTACVALLATVERRAFDQVDALSEAKGNR